MKTFACLFDIDGVLTLPLTQKRKISIIDFQLIKKLTILKHQNIPLALISGRAYPWVQQFLLDPFKNFLEEIPIFMEYGLTSYVNGSFHISQNAKDFRDEFFFPIMSSIKQTCLENDIFFELTPYIDYPVHGSLWLELKHGMISIISNKLVSTEQVHILLEQAMDEYTNDVRLLKHHLGFDIIPKGWGKEKAASEAFKILDPQQKIQNWFIFGDNESDREMCNPFLESTFVDTKIGASETTSKFLSENLFI